MAALLDTGILYASYDRADRWHESARKLLESEPGPLIVPAPVIPEVDHLLGKHLGTPSRMAFYEGLSDGHYFVADLPRDKYPRVTELNQRFQDLSLGFVDAAVVAIGESLGLLRIATTDLRDFEPLASALSLTLLP